MKRLTGFFLGVATAGLLFGCGDNSKQCGSNTTDEDGVCIGGGGSGDVTCTDGTMLNDEGTACVIDADSCQDGTVLIDGACKDPTNGLTVDVTEAAEPNGLGVGGESSAEPAGVLEINEVGEDAVVVSGTIAPRADTNEDGRKEADYDTYLFQTGGPTLLEISVDGVGGVAGGFALLADEPALADYLRLGVNLTGDTARRQVFLPAAGIYVLAIADTRSIMNGDAVGEANSKYFVSIKNLALPTATTIALTSGAGTVAGTIADDEVDFYTAPLGTGFNTLTYRSYDEDFDASIVAYGGGTIHSLVDEVHSGTASAPATSLVFGGVTAAEMSIIAIDHVINTGSAAVDYRLDVTSRTATALKTDGTTATADLVAPAPTAVGDFTYFYFDAVANQPLGFNLSFNTPVKANIVDSAGVTAATFTGVTTAATPTFTSYKGLLRFPTTGRYYLKVLKPGAVAGDDIIATSKIAAVTTPALAFGTPIVGAAPSADYGTAAFTYSLNASLWQQFSITPNVASGGAFVRIIDTRDAYGRLDDVTTSAGLQAPTLATLEMVAAPGTTEVQGFIPAGFGTNYLVTVTTDTGAGTFDLGVAARVFTDLGNHAPPYTAPALATETITDGVHRYFLRTTPGAIVTVSADPTAALAVRIRKYDYDEFVLASSTVTAIDAPATLAITANADGYVAFGITGTALLGDTYALSVVVTAPVVPATYYTAAAGTTTWTNICAHPTARDITPANRDDGLTAPVTVPAGFTFYGTAVTSATVSTNGWLSFASGVVDPNVYFIGQSFPDADFPDQTLAPYFGDLGQARVCTEVIGGKLYVQWRGDDLYESGATVAVQAILDPATDSIEYVYAPFHTSVVGTAGLQQSSTVGQELFYVDETTVHAGTSIKLTHQ